MDVFLFFVSYANGAPPFPVGLNAGAIRRMCDKRLLHFEPCDLTEVRSTSRSIYPLKRSGN